ncbi:MAG: ribosome-binding factor A [Clostridiales bacterium]|nr:MAG: ribosome-binding factor A [Clostridiales bacterium]
MAYDRTLRISEEIRKVVSSLILFELKDPRISNMASITRVVTSGDLRFTTIYVSVLGDEKEKDDTLKGLEKAKGFIRNRIGKSLDLRYTPEPIIKIDENIEYSSKISKIIEDVNTNKEVESENGNKL